MEFNDEIIKQVLNGNFVVAFIFIAIYAFKNPKEFIQTFNAVQFSKIGNLDLALKSKYLKGLSRTVIEDQLEQRYFYLSTGLNAEKLIRQKILEVYAYSEGRVNFRHFVRVNNRFSFKNSTLSIKWGRYECLSLWFLGGAAFISLISVLALILLMLPSVISEDISFDQIDDIVLLMITLTTTGLFYLYSCGILISANFVRKQVEAFNRISDTNGLQANVTHNLESNF